jgi:signal transduction histidine kinase
MASRPEDRRLFQRERELEAARRISEALFQQISIDKLVEEALRTALEVVDAEAGSVLLADREAKHLVFRHSIGVKPVPPGMAIPWEEGIAGAVFHSGRPDVISDVQHDRRHFPGIDIAMGYTTRDMITLPLKRWEAEPIGVLNVLNKREGRLDKDDLSILTIICALTASAIGQAQLFEQAKLAALVRVLGNIGHDVKNMLTPIVMGTSILKSELDTFFSDVRGVDAAKAQTCQEQCNKMIGMLRNSAGRIQDRVKEIADCVKGLSTPPQFSPCKLSAVVQSVINTLQTLAEERGVLLISQGLEALPTTSADEGRLFNAIYNLVHNAIPEVQRGGSVTIAGRVDPDGKHVLLSVIDTGRGMSPDVRESLFSTRAISRKAGGTGLGTKIVKDVIDAHGGTITVESAPGIGTSFHLRLPLCPPANPTEHASSS